MRDREEILGMAPDPDEYSYGHQQDVVIGQRLMLEVLLDIRQQLEAVCDFARSRGDYP